MRNKTCNVLFKVVSVANETVDYIDCSIAVVSCCHNNIIMPNLVLHRSKCICCVLSMYISTSTLGHETFTV